MTQCMFRSLTVSMDHCASPLDSILEGLKSTTGPKQLPFCLVYDTEGTSLYEQIVEPEEYCPFQAETALLEKYAHEIASFIPADSLLVELGCGTATKSAYLLNAFHALHGRCQYVGIDVSSHALEQAHAYLLSLVPGLHFSNLTFVEGEYLTALKQVRERFPDEVLCIIWLGASVGNLDKKEAVSFLRETLQISGSKCQFVCCTDIWKNEVALYNAYHDKKGLTETFIKHGVKNALAMLGYVATEDELKTWVYQVKVNLNMQCVEMWVTFPDGLDVERHGVHLRPNEQVLVEFARKYQIQDLQELVAKSDFCFQAAWRDKTYGCQIVCSQLQAITCCWAGTDALFRRIPDWAAKPIDLRHPFIFYYGHMISFTKLNLLSNVERTKFDIMFSRGIDPVVLDPRKCHKHPEMPSQWPSSAVISQYVNTGRSLVSKVIEDGLVPTRLVCMVLEHEYMHQETLAYMVAQQTKINFENDYNAGKSSSLMQKWETMVEEMSSSEGNYDYSKEDWYMMNGSHCEKGIDVSNYIWIPAGRVEMGCDPAAASFEWDNEVPSMEAWVNEPFWVSRKPVTICQYMLFVKGGGYEREELWDGADFGHFKEKGYKWPATWSNVGGQFFIHRPWTSKHWHGVAEEAVYVSLAEAQAYCKWVASSARVMTEEEYGRIITAGHDYEVENLRDGGWEWTSSPFRGFCGFKPMPEYPEYSADFFDDMHFVLKGSSPATHPCLVRDTFRNFYQRQYRYVFAKFRCCIPALQNGSV